MDYQPPVNQGTPNNMNYQAMSGQGGGMPSGMGMNPMEHHSSHKVWYIVGAVVVILGAVALWYLYGSQATPSDMGAATEQAADTLSVGNTAADILSDLNKTVNDTASLDQEAASSAAAVQGF